MSTSITIYVNHCEESVLTEEGYKDMFEDEVKDFLDDRNAFIDWLEDNYSHIDLWDLTPGGRAKVEAEWLDYARNEIKERNEEWIAYTFKV